jgi:16S rRNA A1518/A1519 N6-dimethyltransferase RsmA/KsgA/DIM1 with predicted DNA glycosylase/AP lyase activity
LGCQREEVDAALKAAGIDPRRRAETLSIDEWVALTDAFSETRFE